jgi:hypothetical protein
MDDLGPVDRQAVRRRLEKVAASDAMALARNLDLELRSEATGGSLVYWEEASALAAIGGARLADFDREARRVTALLSGDREAATAIARPEPIGRAGFNVVDSATGSLDFLLAPMGLTAVVLMSDPVQFLLTTQALLTDAAWVVRVWKKAGLPLPPHPSVEDIRQALGGLLQRSADAVLPHDAAPLQLPQAPAGGMESTLEGGRLTVRGDQIITIVTGLDGDPTFIRYEPARRRR